MKKAPKLASCHDQLELSEYLAGPGVDCVSSANDCRQKLSHLTLDHEIIKLFDEETV